MPTSLPPKVGQALTVAIFIPGTCASMPNRAAPCTFSAESTRRSGLPINVNCVGLLSTTFAGSGMPAAALARAPKLALRLDGSCVTIPRATLQLAASTCQRAAAAATSMARATAPASRSTCQWLRVLVEPPVACSPSNGVAYSASLGGACSTLI